MRVSAKADYALRALIEMAARGDGDQNGRPVSAEELGKLQDIPHNFLQAILADLRKAGIVHAQRGQAGGWRLAQPGADVTVADVIRAVDGPLVSVYGLRPEAVSYNERVGRGRRLGTPAARCRGPHGGRRRLAAPLVVRSQVVEWSSVGRAESGFGGRAESRLTPRRSPSRRTA